MKDTSQSPVPQQGASATIELLTPSLVVHTAETFGGFVKSIRRGTCVFVEPLEARCLLTLVVSLPFNDVSVAEGTASTDVSLSNHFDNSDIVGPVVQIPTPLGTIN